MKRALDLSVALPLFLLLLPLMAVIGLMVRGTSAGPSIHWSNRVGRYGKAFHMPKFRTMRKGTPQVATDRLADPSGYLTPIGGVLRKLSLDELPQLWSVLCGDMSLVGPRPALFNQTELIEARHRLGIDALRPGITGWAQVNGRDDISEQRKVELDAEYLQQSSALFDLRVIWLTVLRVAVAQGVSH
jgi:O-antigen biosynthesis protein WbqP